jgi:predicted nucleic acid-binding protein
MVVFDAGILIKLFSNKASDDKRRLDYLVKTLEGTRERILIPTPALSEYLVKAGDAATVVLEEIRKNGAFRIVSFDARAAIECALAIRRDLAQGNKRGGSAASWQKVKFDHQIVAIAKASGASKIYTEDLDVKAHASRVGIQTLSMRDLALPPEDAQRKLELDP